MTNGMVPALVIVDELWLVDAAREANDRAWEEVFNYYMYGTSTAAEPPKGIFSIEMLHEKMPEVRLTKPTRKGPPSRDQRKDRWR